MSLQDQIEKVRDPEQQVKRMGVPESAVDSGHAFHTYTVTSPDGSGEWVGGCMGELVHAARGWHAWGCPAMRNVLP